MDPARALTLANLASADLKPPLEGFQLFAISLKGHGVGNVDFFVIIHGEMASISRAMCPIHISF